MPIKIAAALVSVLCLVFDHIVISRGPPFTHMHAFRDVVLLLTANAMVWLSLDSDWSMRWRAQLFGAAWIWLIVQLGCSIYLLQSGV